jgi:hypothetical protein
MTIGALRRSIHNLFELWKQKKCLRILIFKGGRHSFLNLQNKGIQIKDFIYWLLGKFFNLIN